MHRRCGWPLDRFTATRIHISKIWKRHPEWSARKVIERLGLERPVRRQWVQNILSDCFQASAGLNAERRRIGRRFRHAHQWRRRWHRY